LKLQFSLDLPSSPDSLIKIATDYENLPTLLPDQLKSVKILEQTNEQTITEETLFFSTISKTKIRQRSLHKNISNNELKTEIIAGPAKGTVVNVKYDKIDTGTRIIVDVDLKLALKYKMITPIIKKWYKRLLTALLYKMNNEAIIHNT